MKIYAMVESFLIKYLETIENVTAVERDLAYTAFADTPLPSIITRGDNDNEAVIHITGVLTPAGPSPIERFFGFDGTGYIDIIAAAKSLESDLGVETVRIVMNTPGGTSELMDEARQAIESLAAKKTVIVENHGMIASAGYFLAVSATEIVAMSPIVVTGSIGIVVAGLDFSGAMVANGIKKFKILSANAPNKQADPTTTSGVIVIQGTVDAMERVFLETVANARNTTVDYVIANFGKGGILIASDPDLDKPDAISVGMIDRLESNRGKSNHGLTASSKIEIETKTEDEEGTVMDLTKLKAEHPALFAEIVKIGTNEERQRVDAHLTMGKASGDMKIATTYISDGTQHSAATNAVYMAAQMNLNAISERGDESEGELDTNTSENTDDNDKALAKATAEALGVEI